MRGSSQCFKAVDVPPGSRVLNQHTKGLAGVNERVRLDHCHIDAKRLGPGLYKRDRLRMTVGSNNKTLRTRFFVDPMHQCHRLCSRGGFIEE